MEAISTKGTDLKAFSVALSWFSRIQKIKPYHMEEEKQAYSMGMHNF